MDVVNFDALVAQGRVIQLSDVLLDEDYFILGHHDPRRREFKATDYPIYAIKAIDVLRNVVTNTDRQMATTTAIISTTNATYLDLPGMTLTTNEIGVPPTVAQGNYQIHFSASYEMSDALTSGNFILNVGGSDIVASEVYEFPTDQGIYRTNLIWQVDSLPANTIIKIRFRVNPGTPGVSTISVYNRTLMINGINSITVI